MNDHWVVDLVDPRIGVDRVVGVGVRIVASSVMELVSVKVDRPVDVLDGFLNSCPSAKTINTRLKFLG